MAEEEVADHKGAVIAVVLAVRTVGAEVVGDFVLYIHAGSLVVEVVM